MRIKDVFKRLLKSKLYKIIKWTLIILLILWWLLLGHITISVPPEKEDEDACFIDQYRISVESPWPLNPIGVWLRIRYFFDEPYYLVVYDDKGHYIGQSSPTLHNDDYDQPNPKKAAACYLMDIKNDEIIIPRDNVKVPLHHKKWWSWVLQWIHD